MHLKLSKTARYAMIQMLYWASYVCISSYSSVFLLERGFSNAQFGIILAVGGAATVIVQPLLASYIDRNADMTVKKAALRLIAAFLAGAAATMALDLAGSSFVVAPLLVSMLALYLLNPLVNALGVEKGGETVDFGLARGLGSGALAVNSLVLGRLIAGVGSGVIPAAMLVLFGLLLVAMASYPQDDAPACEPTSEAGSAGFFRSYPLFAVVVLGLCGLLFGHAATANFGYQVILDKGGSTAEYGWAIAISVMSELPVMFFYSRLEKRFSRTAMLVVSAVAFTAKISLSYLAATPASYLLVQPIQLLAWGLISVNFVSYVGEKVKPEDAVMGQSWFTNAQMIGSIAASLVGGAVIDAAGVSAIIAIGAIVSAIGTAIVCAAALYDSRARAA